MKLWLLSQDVNRGYDTFDSCVVAAETDEAARLIHPNGDQIWTDRHWRTAPDRDWNDWADPECVKVEEIGTAKDGLKGVICASFNAG